MGYTDKTQTLLKNNNLEQMQPLSQFMDSRSKQIFDNIKTGVSLISPNMKIVWMNRMFSQMFPNARVGKKSYFCESDINDNSISDDGISYCSVVNAFNTGKIVSVTIPGTIDDRIYKFIANPIKDNNENVINVVETVYDISPFDSDEDKTEKTRRDILTKIIRYAIAGTDIDGLLSEVVEEVVKVVKVDVCKILETFSNGKIFLLRSSTKQKGTTNLNMKIRAGTDSQASYTLNSDEPVIVQNINNEKRFGPSPIIHSHGMMSGVNVIIPGNVKPFGILSVYATQEHMFDKSDIVFLQSVANLIGIAISHNKTTLELKKLATVVDQSPVMVVITDIKGNIEYVNPKFTETTGYTMEELCGQNPRVFKSGETSNETYKGLWETITSGETWQGEFHNKKKGDGQYWDMTRISPVKNEQGVITNFIGIKEDITNLKNVITENEEMGEQLILSQKMEVMGQLAGGVVHDFNNMLTAISGFASLGLLKVEEGSSVYENLEQINKAVEKATSITRQLLLFSRKQQMEFKFISLNDVIDNLGIMLCRFMDENVAINIIKDPDLWTIHANDSNIEQVIMNLTLNAADAITGIGNIDIKTENVILTNNDLSEMPNSRVGKFVILTVSDTGPGIDNSVINHIFEPFFTTKDKCKGTGLGLSVVYGIAKNHKGWIDVNTTIGKGTTFKIYLPASTNDPDNSKKEIIKMEDIKGNNERILVVEDEEQVRGLIKKVLIENGYKVFEACDANEALAVFEQENNDFHLIFSDVMLSGDTGIDLVDKILTIKPEQKVLLGSGHMDDKSQMDEINARGIKFIEKPYSLLDILKIVKGLIVSGS